MKNSLRFPIIALGAALVYAASLSAYKEKKLQEYAAEALHESQEVHSQVLKLFQASYYFFYAEQFVPGVTKQLENSPELKSVQVLSSAQGGIILFDSSQAIRAGQAIATPTPQAIKNPEWIEDLNKAGPSVYLDGFEVSVLLPSGQYGMLYRWTAQPVKHALQWGLALGIGCVLLLAFLMRFKQRILGRRASAEAGKRTLVLRLWGLRAKFLLTIVLISAITAAIIFFTLSTLQTREESLRIRKESTLFAQFSTSQVVSEFSSFFYFYYADKFLPGIKSIVASNENLVNLRIISRKTKAVLFDSEQSLSAPSNVPPAEGSAVAEFPESVMVELKTKDLTTREFDKSGEHYLSVYSTYRNENREALFWVEYVFSFETLKRSVQAIRRQILVDLFPSLAIGLLIAAGFAQLLISPVKRLVNALQRVAAGDYEVSVEASSSDEIGELVGTFNQMTAELRKKTELRKYLSDSTYRQVMEADGPSSGRLVGTRVEATVLFSDIRNFVTHCENLDAEEVTQMLNDYFSEMVDVVYKHGGEVDKFIGDALLAVFYTAEGVLASTTSLRAIYCALEMKERLAEVNQRRATLGRDRIDIGVGITHGEVISGPIGSRDRRDFTVIGDVVNLASRIEKLSKRGSHTKIVFSGNVEERIRGLLDYQLLGREGIQGKEEPMDVFELVRVRNLGSLESSARGEAGGKDSALPLTTEIRINSIELLGQSRNPEAVETLLDLIGDADDSIRMAAVTALSRLAPPDDERVVSALFERLKKEKSLKLISGMVTALGRLCTGPRILELAPFLDHPDERIAANAVESIGMSKVPERTDLIIPKLSSRNNRVKANTAMALFAAGHVAVIDTLKPMLLYSDPLMRSSAAFAIGELSLVTHRSKLAETWKGPNSQTRVFLSELQACVPMLVSLLRDPEPMVKRQAILALGKIKDRSSVLPILDSIDPDRDDAELLKDVSAALQSIGSHRLVREVVAQLSR